VSRLGRATYPKPSVDMPQDPMPYSCGIATGNGREWPIQNSISFKYAGPHGAPRRWRQWAHCTAMRRARIEQLSEDQILLNQGLFMRRWCAFSNVDGFPRLGVSDKQSQSEVLFHNEAGKRQVRRREPTGNACGRYWTSACRFRRNRAAVIRPLQHSAKPGASGLVLS